MQKSCFYNVFQKKLAAHKKMNFNIFTIVVILLVVSIVKLVRPLVVICAGFFNGIVDGLDGVVLSLDVCEEVASLEVVFTSRLLRASDISR